MVAKGHQLIAEGHKMVADGWIAFENQVGEMVTVSFIYQLKMHLSTGTT